MLEFGEKSEVHKILSIDQKEQEYKNCDTSCQMRLQE